MEIKIDKSLILNRIKLHYGFKNDYQFAEFLDIKPPTLANWHSRNTFDLERIFSKCKDIDANWLLSGEGNMLKNSLNSNDDIYNQENVLNITKISEENYIEWKDKYISLLEKYNALLEDKLKAWIDKQV